jgi:signal transduction histidine kinase
VEVAAVVADAGATTATRAASLAVETDARTVMADRDRLVDAIENLLRNAVGQTGPAVSIRVVLEEDAVAVADDGPGIPPDDRATVFEKGYTTRETGTGYGLTPARAIVEAHGWRFAVTESVENGARFEIRGLSFVA